MRETWVQSLGQEDPLEKGMATHSSILAWRIHGQKSLEGHSLWGLKESDTTERLTHTHTHTQTIPVSCAGGIFPAKFDREVTGHAQYTFPQTLLWSALGPTGNQKVLLHHLRGLGWGRGTGAKLPI